MCNAKADVCYGPTADIEPWIIASAVAAAEPHQDGAVEHSTDFAVCFVSTQAFGLGCREACMNGIIYLIGLIVVIMAILSFLGLR